MTAMSESRILPDSRSKAMEDDRYHLAQPGPSSSYSSDTLRTPSNPTKQRATTTTTTTSMADQGITDNNTVTTATTHNDRSYTSYMPSAVSNKTDHTANANATMSPPRYTTRASLGSVAFSPGKSPGSTARYGNRSASSTTRTPEKGGDDDRHNPLSSLSYLSASSSSHQDDDGSSSSAHVYGTGLPNSNAPNQQQYEYYAARHASNAPTITPATSNKEIMNNDGLSPELAELEAYLANDISLASSSPSRYDNQPPTTPGHHHSTTTTTSSTSTNKKRTPPTPLDLSPPTTKPSWSSVNSRLQERQHSSTAAATSPAESVNTSRISATRTSTAADTSSSNISTRQPYTGLGLGLPFSHSHTSDSLSSLASSSSSTGSGTDHLPHTYAGKQLASPLLGGTSTGNNINNNNTAYHQQQSPNLTSSSFSSSASTSHVHHHHQQQQQQQQYQQNRQRSSSDLLLSSPENLSPIVDRRGLVGLGELSTPRWTAAIHERRWNHLNQHHQSPYDSVGGGGSSGNPPLPSSRELPDEEGAEESDGHHRRMVESESGEGWEGDVLGGYMDDKENDRYANYRQSMPAIDTYRSFSDIAASAPTTGTANSHGIGSGNAGEKGQISNSSSAYSLDALSIPESNNSSSSSSNSEAGAFYTPSLRVNQQIDPMASYMLQHDSASNNINNHHSKRPRDNEDTFKIPKDRNGNDLLDSSTSTVLSPTTSKIRNQATPAAATIVGAGQGGRTASGGSRTSSRSTTSTSVQLSSVRKGIPVREKERGDVPSYMRGTAASASKRTSTTSIDDIYRKHDAYASPSSIAMNNEDSQSRLGSNNKTRHSSPPQQLKGTHARVSSTARPHDATLSRQSGHSRQSSITSNSGGAANRKHVPTPIDTNRDGLPQRSHESHKVPTSAKTSKSPSAIAHHILQQTLQQGLHDSSNVSNSGVKGSHRPAAAYEDFDISAYAAVNPSTAEALSRLDGTSNASSPRVSRAFSASSFKSSHTTGGHDSNNSNVNTPDHTSHTPRKHLSGTSNLSRQNSKASMRTTSPHSRPSSSRKSWAKGVNTSQSPGLPLTTGKDGEYTSTLVRRKSDDQHTAFNPGQTLSPPVKSPLRASTFANSSAPNTASQPSGLRKLSLSSSASSPALAAAAAAQGASEASARSPVSSTLSPAVGSNQPPPSSLPSRRSSGNRPSSSSGGDVPPTPSLSSKRSSSASLAFGTSTSGSRDSTSATSISAYGSPAQGKMSKSRRGSTSSDVSSVHSGVDGPNRSDRSTGLESSDAEQQAFARLIPPVPPLPKDWELYRPSTTGGDSSVPTSASASSFKERDASRISAMQGLGVADHRPGQGVGSRSASLEKPAGPRPLRDASSSSLSPAGVSSPSLASTPSLPSPATTTASLGSNGLGERHNNASKTPTKPKWSLSNAFGMSKSPTLPSSSSQASSLSSFSSSSLEKSTSYNDLSAVNKRNLAPANRTSLSEIDRPSELSRRKLASVPDIKSLAAGGTHSAPEIKLQGLPHSASAHQIGGRARTDSQSTSSTANATGKSEGHHHGLPTSPGRSISSLLSSSRKESGSRQTPSSIPFWSRRPSGSHQPQPTVTPSSPGSRKASASGEGLGVPGTPSQSEEKTGRRSILGINLFGRSSARKSLSLNKDNLPPSPGLPSQYTASNRASLANKGVRQEEKVSELGMRGSQESKRSSVGARASSLITGRKRGKTLPSSTEPPVKPASVNLPPMQMNALPSSTASRYSSAPGEGETANDAGTPSQKRPLPVPPRVHRPSRVGDSLFGKDPLPTITGSPSVALNNTGEPAETSGQASKPATPTRIPRLASSRSNVPSPQYLEPPTSGVDLVSGESTSPQRRGSLKPGSGISSSVPDQNSSYLQAGRDAGGNTSSSSSQGTSPLVDSAAEKAEEQPKRRVLGASASQVPVLSSSRTSGKYQSTSAAVPSDKRRSLILSEKEDFKPTRSPLRVSQPTAINGAAAQKQTLPASSSSLATSTPRLRTKTSETPSSSHKSSTLVDGLPTSRSMGSSIVSKLSIPTRMSKSATTSNLRHSPAPSEVGGRSTISSRYGTPVGEDELRGDEEMMEFVQRQRTKQASRGMSEEESDRLFTFPEPIEPTRSLSPHSALQLYRHEMCEYEHDEIMDYKEVYYVGRRDTKKMATKLDTTNNHGYDDERGDYQIIPGDHIQFRYEIIDTLGKGSFGQVLRCRDHSTGDMVAVKIIRNKKRFHHQALVEIKVLENLKRWDPEEKNCLLKIGENFTFRGHLCITTELLGINLYELIKANSFRGFSTTLIRRFTTQILAALSLLRHHRVVHCDLKPENILLKHPAKSAVKVIDFGSSCFENEKVYTYIQSRFYRSPEVILGMNYHMAIDMWSLGCILAELYTGMPIFPGENEASQLACIMEVLGVPDKHIVDRSSRKKLFFDSTGNPRPTVDSKGRRRRPGAKTLQAVLKCDDELFVDFIAKCLTWDPDRRLKPGPALRHPFCARGRALASAPIPPRQSTLSTRSLLLSSNISTPRRLEKKPSESSSVYSTPASRHDASVPSTAPVQRMRTISAAVPGSVGPAYTSYRSYAK